MSWYKISQTIPPNRLGAIISGPVDGSGHMTSDDPALIWSANLNGSPVGYALVVFPSNRPPYVGQVTVGEEFRRQGVAKQLYATIDQYLQQNNLQPLRPSRDLSPGSQKLWDKRLSRMTSSSNNWYKSSQVEYRGIDPEEDWDDADEADQLFKQVTIRHDSTKNISHVAKENGVVIGALASGWSMDDNYEEQKSYVFSFDLVVKPEYRRKGIGLSLIHQAITEYERVKIEYEDMGFSTYMRLWVVNPHLIPVLESQFRFEIEADHGPGGVHMVRY